MSRLEGLAVGVAIVAGSVFVFAGLGNLCLYLGTPHPDPVPLFVVQLVAASAWFAAAAVACFAQYVRREAENRRCVK